jgi:VanZ family protein
LQPSIEPVNTTHIFLSYTDKTYSPVFSLGQWKSSLVLIPNNEPGTFADKNEIIFLRKAMPKGEKRLLNISSGKRGTIIYLDGKKKAFYSKPLLSNKHTSIDNDNLILGNDPTGKKPWSGKIFTLTLYKKEFNERDAYTSYQKGINGDDCRSWKDNVLLNYCFGETSGNWAYDKANKSVNLWIPNKFKVPKPTVLAPFWKNERYINFKDIFINIIGFFPLGFFGMPCLNTAQKITKSPVMSIIGVVIIGAIISLIIELLQVGIPSRYSSSTDLICNILGALIGAYFYGILYLKISNVKVN